MQRILVVSLVPLLLGVAQEGPPSAPSAPGADRVRPGPAAVRAAPDRAAVVAAPDSAAVVAAALDYIEGWFTGDAGRVARAVHPELLKRRVGPDGRLHDQDAATLVRMAERAGGGAVRSFRDRVRVLDLTGRSAVVRIDAPAWIDFLFLAPFDGEWRIVQVLWETRRDDGTPDGRTR